MCRSSAHPTRTTLQASGRREPAGSTEGLTFPARRCALIAAWLVFATAGCDPWMVDQPKYEPLESSPLIVRGEAGGPRWTREPVPGTVARGFVRDAPYDWDEQFMTGAAGGEFVDEVPQRALNGQDLQAVMLRGRERYGIFCAPCHDLAGTGNGRIPQRGYPYPPSFHSEELRRKPLGHYFRVISSGMGRMPPYGKQVPPEDRWAIAAYIRALQLSQHAPISELPQTDARQIERSGPLPERNLIPGGPQ